MREYSMNIMQSTTIDEQWTDYEHVDASNVRI